MERTSRNNYWSCQHRGLQACLEGPGQEWISHWAFEHFSFLYHQHRFTALAHIARAQHISAEDGLYCPLQIRHLDLDLFGIRWAPFCLENPKKPSSFPSNQRSVSWYLRYLDHSLNLHQMYQWKTEDSACIAWGSTQLSVSRIHSCTAIPNFAQKTCLS